MHIALGRAYPECGGTNESSIHWDIIKDTRQQGEIYLDDQLVFSRGSFLVLKKQPLSLHCKETAPVCLPAW